MKLSIKLLVGTTITLGIVCIILTHLLLSRVATAQTSEVNITHMTGDSGGVWLATDDRRLIHCWFPQDAARRDVQANCRVIERWRTNIIR